MKEYNGPQAEYKTQKEPNLCGVEQFARSI